MTQRVLDSLTRALRAAFPTAGIYTEEVPQGLQPGDFLVRLEGVDMAPAPGGVNRWELRVAVCCFLAEGPPDLGRMEALFQAAACLELPGGLRLRGVRGPMSLRQGVAALPVRYAFYAAPGAAEKMEELDYAAC